MPADVHETTGRAASTAAENRSGDEPREVHGGTKESLNRIGSLVAEAKEYVSYFVSAKVDSVKLSVRKAVLYAGLGLVGGVALVAVVCVAVALLLSGAAQGLGALFGGRMWLGNLTTGLIVMVGLGLAAYVGVRRMIGSHRLTTVQKYEKRQDWERRQFGRSVEEAASSNGKRS